MYPPSLVAEFLSTPWALMEERLRVIVATLARGGPAPADSTPAPSAESAERAGAPRSRANSGSVAVIPIHGVITQRGSLFDAIFGDGSASTVAISRALQGALGDDAIKTVVLDIDSPGGSVYGVGELADEIYAARAKKPIVAFANSLAASAAYWLAAAASEVYVTPGGEVGSIGVWSAHQDWSKAFEDMGVKTTMIAAGKYKTEGNPYEPLSGEAKDFMQQRVNEYYGAFTRAVANGRGLPVERVRSGMGQGRVLGADQARAERMVDGILSASELIAALARGKLPAGRAGEPLTGTEAAYESGLITREEFRRRTGAAPSGALERRAREEDLRRSA